MRVVIELKKNESAEIVLNNLYKMTQLQDSFGMNLVALIDGQPKVLNLKEILEAFLKHRREVITRRVIFELRKAREKSFLLEGLAVAVGNMEEVVQLIKQSVSPADAKARLIERNWESGQVNQMLTRAAEKTPIEAFRPSDVGENVGFQDGFYKLSEKQAVEILQMRLQRLTSMEQDKIISEYNEIILYIADLLDILSKPERVLSIIDET